MPIDGNELFEYEANDRSSSHDYSSQYIESMTRYLISAAQTRENGGDITDWWVLHDSAGLKATVKEMLEYGCWGQVLNEIQGKIQIDHFKNYSAKVMANPLIRSISWQKTGDIVGRAHKLITIALKDLTYTTLTTPLARRGYQLMYRLTTDVLLA